MPRTMAAASRSVSTRLGATCAGVGTGTDYMRTGMTAKRVSWDAGLALGCTHLSGCVGGSWHGEPPSIECHEIAA